MASRYNTYDSRSSTTSSHFSDPSSSSDFKCLRSPRPTGSGSRALVKSKPADLARTKSKTDHNLTAMVKKFMEKKPTSNATLRAKGSAGLLVPADLIAEDLKKTARKGANFGGLHKKLFGKGGEKKEVKALTEVKGNTRTLAMVLRSERELLSATKDQELEISDLKMMLEEKNREVEKLKDLCLQQREEIKSLKSAVLFPDVMNSQRQELLQKQGSELKQAREVIPTLQKQVSSLTGQLQCLVQDVAEVKAIKHPLKTSSQGHGISPRTPSFEQEEATNSLEFSSVDNTPPGSPDDMFLKDLNPCLTPYYIKSKSKEFETLGYDSPCHDMPPEKIQTYKETDFATFGSFSKSSDYRQISNMGDTMARAAGKSDERKCRYGKPLHHKLAI